MSDINDFIKKIEAEFEEISPGSLNPGTNFREMKDWSSMHALIIIALIDTEYGISLNGEHMRSVSTIKELFDLIGKKKVTQQHIND
ncbi:MAG: acyl carrier protein [Bacteroidetes bacterium]|nr:acyl carrier protein [Bacteroidota bacterium]